MLFFVGSSVIMVDMTSVCCSLLRVPCKGAFISVGVGWMGLRRKIRLDGSNISRK